ncbi:glutamate--tRNA ligase [Rubricoccus marinus]|uniref:Glutamate--tRNA ligase n=1 Tax=Rubricoccus marinus TaxID=716817 RepID=A0A259U0E1_9BACT|nr:glutamate--tRNA ligase [Rubricoccus marinus]OZC03307.1 glutamate--tRNA ligase [Rubricoccus marinus]
MPDSPVRVRFAPSPTGLLHIGGLRTALYNWLLAEKTGGTFVLRIEDTDRARFVEGAEEDIRESLAWAGLTIAEGPLAGGPHAPYRQSERSSLYKDAADRLLASGDAYIAFDTAEELDAMRERLTTKENPSPRYDRASMTNSLTLGEEETQARIARGDEHVVRLRVPEGETVTFIDLIRGEVSFETSTVDDQVLVKSDGLPTYHLANVVDDHAMEITHVIRGEEWLSSTPKHILLYRALGWAPPALAHLPLILAPTGGKLSKRNADKLGIPVNVRDYVAAGYEPEAVVNWLAFLGWNPGTEQELFSLEELAEAFSIERIGQSGVQLSMDKLQWFNGQHLRALAPEAVAERASGAVGEKYGDIDRQRLTEAAALLHERLDLARDLADAGYLFEAPQAYDEAGVKKRWKEDSAALCRAYADRLEALDAFTLDSTEAAMREMAETEEVGFGRIVHPVRIATTGTMVGAGMFDTLVFLGQDESVARLRRAADALG